MKIDRFVSGAIATDGGSISCRAILDDGGVLDLGLDARIPRSKSERLIFVGAGGPGVARTIARHSTEEDEIISALREYLSRDPADEVAKLLLDGVLDR
jgi:hypothetical protein